MNLVTTYILKPLGADKIFILAQHGEGYWALVSFSNGNGDSCIGILKPFTVFSALLCIVDDESFAHSVLHELGGVDLPPFVMKRDKEIWKSDMIATHDREVKSTKNKRRLRLFQDLTWNDFCKIKKSRSCSLTVADKSETNKEVTKEIEIRVADLTQKSDWPIPSSVSLGEESLALLEFKMMLPLICALELWKKHESGNNSQSETSAKELDDACGTIVAVELTKLLLREPKEYCDTLGNVVDRIYTKMDLLLFADEDESPNHLLNSEESNQSWRDRQHGDVMGENSCINEPNSARGEQENDNESPQGSKREEHARKVMEARQRRERAQRFSSFTRVADLQRVWAPKQPKAMKSNTWKMSNMKDHKRGSYDKVCETPMSRNKRSCPQGSSTNE
ncbi:hypothetical protein EZV62_006009 [Acer yangbiense]|uniref:Uncharacterized protein n=1 Tax=Acer yangbiense TaxID=1000413 RepID=A0A5C7IQJ9_9ROSI|nr:hypothetical protein EZV62_006009 [Acer yangbiense]